MNSLVPDSSFHMDVFDDAGKWNGFGLSEHGLIYKPVLVKYKANFTSNIWDKFPLLMLGSPLKHIWKLQQLVESPYHTSLLISILISALLPSLLETYCYQLMNSIVNPNNFSEIDILRDLPKNRRLWFIWKALRDLVPFVELADERLRLY